ncbi:hypothetical protein OAN80_00980, partial [Alphaproteobacteria bacterium]|nr:hypothetical protein [Alphaproteobacteria bacterium]
EYSPQSCSGNAPHIRKVSTKISSGAPPTASLFSGSWLGHFRSRYSTPFCVNLSIIKIEKDGRAYGTYSWPSSSVDGGSIRFTGQVDGLRLRFSGRGGIKFVLYHTDDLQGSILQIQRLSDNGSVYGILRLIR